MSLQLRRVLPERGLTGAEIALRLNIKPPLVSCWLSPTCHQPGLETLRTPSTWTSKFQPRECQTAS